MMRKNLGWTLIIAGFVIGWIGSRAILADILSVALVVAGAVIVWQENGKNAKALKAVKAKDSE